jgi:hypothetical protein
MSIELITAIVLVPAALAAAYFWIFRDFKKMDDRDNQDFGNPG